MKRGKEELLQVELDHQDERASAYGRSVVFMRQAYPNMALMTYDNRIGRGADHLVLAKFVVGIGPERKMLTYESCDDSTTADNIPGGLESKALTLEGERVCCHLYPAILPEQDAYRGAAILHIESDIPGIFVRFGCGGIGFMHFSPNEAMRGQEIDCQDSLTEVRQASMSPCVILRRKERDFLTCVQGNMDFTVCDKMDAEGKRCGSYAEGYTAAKEIWLMIGFSVEQQEATELAALNPAEELKKIEKYYSDKFENLYIHTPDAALDRAFTHAYLNLEYSWLYPLGWIECIQHWPTMFHMEQTAAEEWAGNTRRTKETLRSQLKYMQPDGAVIELHPNHTGRRDWGGENHFFFRELLHYLRMTGDAEFAKECAPYMEKIMAQTFGEYDAVDSGILAWHSQIGNQEDFESTPGRGAAPGAVGVEMQRLMADFCNFLGETEKAQYYAARADYSAEAWKKKLWRRDLGRAIWFADDHGEERLDTTYHGICYPILFDMVDSVDAQSSMDHLTHRMTGKEGEVYQSNHFGDHRPDWVPTWGMQAGSDMQPFATAAYAKLGRHEEAFRPLKFVADRVCGEYQRGSFPETANETRFAYFSPSAGVYAQSIVEDIFGVKRDCLNNRTEISPCFPDSWQTAELCLPQLKFRYEKIGQQITLQLRFAQGDATNKKLVWRTDFTQSATVKVGGEPVPVQITHACGFSVITAELGNNAELTVKVDRQPMQFALSYSQIAVCGEKPQFTLQGAELCGISDRCGVLDENGAYRRDLLQRYEPYGDFGLVNFARRSFAVRLCYRGTQITVPCGVTVVPRFVWQAEALPQTGEIVLTLRNHSQTPVDTALQLKCGGQTVRGQIRCPAQEQSSARLSFVQAFARKEILPGKNRAWLWLQEGECRELTVEAPLDRQPVLLDIPANQTVPYQDWRSIAFFAHHGCAIMEPDAFLKEMPESISVDGMLFRLCGGFVPVATRTHRFVQLPVGKKVRKIYLLFSAFADDHEICSQMFDLELVCAKENAYLQPIYKKTLCLPGDLDFGFGDSVVAGFSTYHPGVQRPGVLPRLTLQDYEETDLPRYPAYSLWCKNRAVQAGGAVFNLVEMDMGQQHTVEIMNMTARASDAAGGIFAVAVL